MKLHLTPLSHFSRKVVVVLEELGVEYERVYVPDLLSSEPADFGGNPILRVPVLEDGDVEVFESDSIVRYLVEQHDPEDRFGVVAMGVEQRNALACLSAVMGAEVELLLSTRSGTPHDAYFARHRAVIEHCLGWIEREGPGLWPDRELSYLDIALVCMWDHLGDSGVLPERPSLPWIEGRVAGLADRPSIAASSIAAMRALQYALYPEQRPRDENGPRSS